MNGISAARYEYLPLSEIEWRNILKKSFYIMETKLVTLLLDKEVSQTILFHSKTKARYKLCHIGRRTYSSKTVFFESRKLDSVKVTNSISRWHIFHLQIIIDTTDNVFYSLCASCTEKWSAKAYISTEQHGLYQIYPLPSHTALLFFYFVTIIIFLSCVCIDWFVVNALKRTWVKTAARLKSTFPSAWQ